MKISLTVTELWSIQEKEEKKTSETDSIKFKISSKTPRGKKDSTKKTPS